MKIVSIIIMMVFGIQLMSAQALSPTTRWHWEKGTIVIDVPKRPEGPNSCVTVDGA